MVAVSVRSRWRWSNWLRLVLVVRDLQGVSELGLILAGLQAAADAADPSRSGGRPRCRDGGPHDEAHGLGLARGRLHTVHPPGVLLVEEQAVQVGADRLISGGQPGGERRPAGPPRSSG